MVRLRRANQQLAAPISDSHELYGVEPKPGQHSLIAGDQGIEGVGAQLDGVEFPSTEKTDHIELDIDREAGEGIQAR